MPDCQLLCRLLQSALPGMQARERALLAADTHLCHIEICNVAAQPLHL